MNIPPISPTLVEKHKCGEGAEPPPSILDWAIVVIGTLEQRSELFRMDTDLFEKGLHTKQLPKWMPKRRENKQTKDKMPSVSEAVERFQLVRFEKQ